MTEPGSELERVEAERARRGPVLRKAPGPAAWFDVRRRSTGHWAFSLNRVTGLLLVGYLYLHLAVLSTLLFGARAWDRFLDVATTPLFLGLDVLLVSLLLTHGLNGLRVALIGTGIAPSRQKAMFYSMFVLGWILLLATILHLARSE
jgi:succinate dehydrogenase / fumarate reductase, cytochrome b subunit